MTTELVKRLRAYLSVCAPHVKQREGHLLLQEATDALESSHKQGWIPVGERLPEQGAGVLLTADGRVRWGYRRAFPGKGSPYHGVHGVIKEEVTHWMPLPSPPVKEK